MAIELTYDVLKQQNFRLDQFPHSFIFIYSVEGSARLQIDLTDMTLSKGNGLIIRPAQIYRCLSISDDAVAFGVALGESCLLPEMKKCLQTLALDSSPFPVEEERRTEIKTLFRLITGRNISVGHPCEGVMAMYARSFAALLIESMKMRAAQFSHERIAGLPLLTRLEALFDSDLHISRLPSHYATLLDLTPTYLNKRLHATVGLNISLFIRRESIVRAARMLAMTDMSVSEIAHCSGYDDPAYFTRLFNKIAGMTPRAFRTSCHR